MVRRLNGRRFALSLCVLLAVLGMALPVLAQSTGIVKGVVKDEKGQPVEGAKISVDFQDGVNRHFETKSDKKGEFVQIGLPGGRYKITAEKDKLTASQTVTVRVQTSAQAMLVLGVNAAADAKEVATKTAELKKAFDEGVAASRAGNQDEAIAGFTRAIEVNPNCFDCYYNVGYAYAQKKDYEKAEASYKKAIEVKPNYAEAYTGLANIYNAQRKFDEAGAASAKASEFSGGAGTIGGNADALFNQGVILWNGGKIPEAKKAFESAIQANPNHAESHYQLGMALVNEGNLAGATTEFETYLTLAPTGPNATQAKALVATLKKD